MNPEQEAALYKELEQLREENARLQAENAELQAANEREKWIVGPSEDTADYSRLTENQLKFLLDWQADIDFALSTLTEARKMRDRVEKKYGASHYITRNAERHFAEALTNMKKLLHPSVTKEEIPSFLLDARWCPHPSFECYVIM